LQNFYLLEIIRRKTIMDRQRRAKGGEDEVASRTISAKKRYGMDDRA
jgi:hypothetical protein